MMRDRLYDLLSGMLAAKGREASLLGGRLADARSAFCAMTPEGDLIHVYFEIPLLGDPGFDVHCSVTHEQTAGAVDVTSGEAWQAALRWFRDAGPFETSGDDIFIMAEADTSAGLAGQSGMYLIQRERDDLIRPFLEVLGEGRRCADWEHFAHRLPAGWETTYVGLFPGRPDGLLRVNLHPAQEGAVGIREAWMALGLDGLEEMLDLWHDLIACARGFDVQLDVDARGRARGPVGLEFYLGDKDPDELKGQEFGARALQVLEERGLADERWRLAADACMSRRLDMPTEHGLKPCIVSVRPFSVKFKVSEGQVLPAKLYLHADAGLLGDR